MFKKIIVLCCLVIGILGFENVEANTSSNIVFMTFSDNTTYKKINSPQIFSEYLLNDILDLEEINLVEHSYDEKTLKLEKRLTSNESVAKEAIAQNDFASMFNLGENDINQKNVGDSVPLEDAKIMGKKYAVGYILHGSVDSLSSGIKETSALSIGVTERNPYIEAVVTARIVDTQDGKVIWSKSVKGIGKDSYISTKHISAGTSELNSELFYEALEKASKKLVKELAKDLEKGKLKLRKGEVKL